MYVIHVGVSGFPKGFAAIQRIRLTFKAIKHTVFTALVISKRSMHNDSPSKKLGRFDEVAYLHTGLYLHRPASFLMRRLDSMVGLLGELSFIVRKRKKISVLIYYGTSFTELLYYRVVSKAMGCKLCVQYVEFRSSIAHRDKLLTRINDFLFDNRLPHFCDGVIVISEFLKDRVKCLKKDTKYFKLPAICDYDTFTAEAAVLDYRYLLYCGTIYYYEVIFFIIDIYEKLRINEWYNGKLMLIIGGANQEYLKQLDRKIAQSPFSEDIILKLNLPHHTLYPLYASSDLLFIPLRNNIQDTARFPHKIGEYTASGRPIISTDVGEIGFYFKDTEDAILAQDYTVESYLEKLKDVVSDLNKLDLLGTKGREKGYKSFHYANFSGGLEVFFKSL